VSRPLYSARFIAEFVLNGSVVLYEVPADRTAVVRQVVANAGAGATGSGTISVVGDPITFVVFSWCDQETDTRYWQGRLVLPGPSSIIVQCTGGADFGGQVEVSGYLLNGAM
jgi:hypothetical protein